MRRVLPRVRDIRRIGSAALDLVRVAERSRRRLRRDGPQRVGPRGRWLVVKEAGALLGGPVDDVPTRDLTWAAAPGIADALSSLVRELTARVVGSVGDPR